MGKGACTELEFRIQMLVVRTILFLYSKALFSQVSRKILPGSLLEMCYCIRGSKILGFLQKTLSSEK